MALSASLFINHDERAAIRASDVNSDLVTFRVADVDVYMTPAQARRAAAVLLADATRCETWHAEQALAAQAEAA